MKTCLTILLLSAFCFLLSSEAQTFNVAAANVGSIGAAAAPAPCASPTVGTYNEGFETATTFYELAGWAESAPVGFTASPGSGTSICTQSGYFTNTDSGAHYLYYDVGGAYTQWSVRFSVWLETIGNHADYNALLELDASQANGRAIAVYTRNLSGVPYLYVLGTSESSPITLTTNAWHTVDLHGDFPGVPGGVSLKVDGGSEVSVGSFAQTPRFIIFGPCYFNNAGCSYYYDAISWKTNSNVYLP